MDQKTWQRDFVTRQHAASLGKPNERNREISLLHKWGTSAISRKLKNGSQKTSRFASMSSVNFLKDATCVEGDDQYFE